jgi:hypothetical protein
VWRRENQCGDAIGRERAAARKIAILFSFRTAMRDLGVDVDMGTPAVAFFDEPETHALSTAGAPKKITLATQLLARYTLGFCLNVDCRGRAAGTIEQPYTYAGDQRWRRERTAWCPAHRPAKRAERDAAYKVVRQTQRELDNASFGDLTPVR